MDFVYKFPVVKGIQANRVYYIAMVPLKMLSRLFPGEDEYVPPEYRAQSGYSDVAKPPDRRNGNRLSGGWKPQFLLVRRCRLSGVA